MKRAVLAILLAFGFLVSAFGQTGSDFFFTENNGEITITGFWMDVVYEDGQLTILVRYRPDDLVIPGWINGMLCRSP